MEYVLGADIGSGSVKLTLLSRQGHIAGTAMWEYHTNHPQIGWCEQDPEDWCRAFRAALAQLLKETGIQPDQIKALAPDAATHTAVLLDENRQLIRPAILWTDQRCREQVKYLCENHLNLVREHSLNTPTTIWTLPQLMWLREHEPENWARIRHILFAKDYLRMRLMGSGETDTTDTIDAAGSMFYHVNTECWSEELCRIGGINPGWLPRIRRPDDTAGFVSESTGEEFGLAPGTRVLVGTTDTVMEVLAAGSVEPGHTTVKLATAGRSV